MVSNEGISIKEPYSITNLQRVLQNKDVQSKLKFSWDNGNIIAAVDEKKLMEIFKKIVTGVGGKKVKEIYNAIQQNKFVDNIINDLGINISKIKTDTYVVGVAKEKDTASATTTKTTPGRTPLKPSWDRKRLIDYRRTHLRIPDIPGNIKTRNIHHELAKKIDVRDAPNAAAVLARVLIEFSINNYQKNNGLVSKDSLHKEVKSVAGDMLKNGKIEQHYHDEIIRICTHDVLLSVRTLQRFVHSFDFSPDRQTLCTLWDNIDKFIALCWK